MQLAANYFTKEKTGRLETFCLFDIHYLHKCHHTVECCCLGKKVESCLICHVCYFIIFLFFFGILLYGFHKEK